MQNGDGNTDNPWMGLDSNTSTLAELSGGAWSAPEAWMIGASTRLVDCWTPQCEWLRLPAIRWSAWNLSITISDASGESPKGRSRLKRGRPCLELAQPLIGLDLRPLGGGNIAHAMIAGVMRFLAAQRALIESGVNAELKAILPKRTASYVLELYRVFDVPVITTDAYVKGRMIDVPLLDPQHIQLAHGLIPKRVQSLLDSDGPDGLTRVFLARRGARAIQNLGQVESCLAQRGVATVYPEKSSVVDQLRLLWNAELVVGVHGAALALLLPRVARSSDRPLKMVEMFGPGYIVSLYRCLAAGIGASWTGIRGRVMPQVVRDLDVLGPNNMRFRIANALRGWCPGRWLPPDTAYQRSHQRSRARHREGRRRERASACMGLGYLRCDQAGIRVDLTPLPAVSAPIVNGVVGASSDVQDREFCSNSL
jgi:hypothetical protein